MQLICCYVTHSSLLFCPTFFVYRIIRHVLPLVSNSMLVCVMPCSVIRIYYIRLDAMMLFAIQCCYCPTRFSRLFCFCFSCSCAILCLYPIVLSCLMLCHVRLLCYVVVLLCAIACCVLGGFISVLYHHVNWWFVYEL